MKSVSVVIPSYRGRALLEKNLPFLQRAIAVHRAPVEIIIVDDAGGDDTGAFIRERYPRILLLENDVNLGFAETINRGFRIARYQIVLALNNDIQVGEDLFAGSLRWFDDPAVFSVTPNMIDPARSESQSLTRLEAGVCWYRTRNLQLRDLPEQAGEIPIFFGSGGASFYDRKKLLDLGGFDPIYHPFYVEDVDLSYRAWKCGWKCLFDPTMTVFHETSSTILALHRKRKIKFIGDRNRTLFLWLNITDPLLIARYFLCLPFSLLYDIIGFRKYKFVGFFRALRYLPMIPGGRSSRKARFRVSDRDVIKMVSR
jgi:GT2 family glycosyltransferase